VVAAAQVITVVAEVAQAELLLVRLQFKQLAIRSLWVVVGLVRWAAAWQVVAVQILLYPASH
jgi:hypothetical protein